MSAKHTPGRLQAGVSKYQGVQSFTAVSEGNEQKIVAMCGLAGALDELESIANACRLAACWNTCEGISTEHLERHGLPDLAQKISDIVAQRDELLEALKALRDSLDPDDWMGGLTMHDFIDSAIAKAIG